MARPLILPDTSAWIEFDRATGSSVQRRLRRAFETGEELSTTGVVVVELLAGARDERRASELGRLLDRCTFVPLDEPSDEEVAAAIFRACRRAGETVRHLPDCLIAAVAIRAGVEVLHRDADFDAIARHAPLAVAAP